MADNAAGAGPSSLQAQQAAQQQQQQQQRRRRPQHAPKAATTLLALLHAVTGRRLIFELRGDAIVTGRLLSVDDQMK